VAVRAGSPRPDIGTAETLRQALRRAKTVAVPGGTAAWFTKVLNRLGISGEIEVKSTGRRAESVAMVARGEA